MTIVKGENVVVFLYDNGAWRPYACATSCDLDVSTSLIETSTTGSGQFATFMPQKHSISGSLSGMVSLDAAGMLSLPDLRARQLAMQKFQMRFTRTDDNGNVYTDAADFYITSSSDSGNVNEVNTYSITLQGTGALTQIFTPTPLLLSAMKRYPQVGSTTAAAGGETSIVISLLIGKDIISVEKDGIGNCQVITSGTPSDKQVMYDSATGTFTWAIPFEVGETYLITYQDIL